LNTSHVFDISGISVYLLQEKAMFIPELQTLVISDLHIGKTAYFRKKGIALPFSEKDKTIENLKLLIKKLKPETLIFLGDLFHSFDESIIPQLEDCLFDFPEIQTILVKGNHDVFPERVYQNLKLTITETWYYKNLMFTHEPMETIEEGKYNIAGHIHPAVKVRGKGRQVMRLPCFYFGKSLALMPAFGYFTGAKTIIPKKGEHVFVLGDGLIFPMHHP
jgi:DNA ligase-associated metallophosphoesterase